MEKIFDISDNLLKPLKTGEIIKGKIIGVGRSAVYLDLGPPGTGIIYGKEFYEGKDILKELEIGDNLSGKVIDPSNEDGYIELSITRAQKELSWQKLAENKEKDEIIKVKILEANKGGLLAKVSGIPAFLPVSQLSSEHYPKIEGGDQTKILKELKKFIGKELEVKVIDLSQKEKKLIISEKAKETKKIKEILKNYKVGDVVEGEITAILDFGVFLKFGKENLEGLIHISELDWRLIEDPSEIVKVGEKVKARITKIFDGKVSLSLKALKKDPWKNFGKKHKKGEIISGKISKFNPFGAFVKINEKIQGLCHISEFGSQEKMKSVLEIEKKCDFEILSIEPEEHRLVLKFKK